MPIFTKKIFCFLNKSNIMSLNIAYSTNVLQNVYIDYNKGDCSKKTHFELNVIHEQYNSNRIIQHRKYIKYIFITDE